MDIKIKNIYEWPLTMRMLIIVLCCAMVFYGGYLYDISSLTDELATSQQAEADLKVQFKSAVSKQKQVKQELTQYPKLQNQLVSWQSTLIKYSDLPKLINEILKIGADSHIQFNLFTPDLPVRRGDFYVVPIKVIAVGNYHQMGSFMSQVANMAKIVVVQNFTMTPETNESDKAAPVATSDLLTTLLTLEVYYLAEKNSKQKG